MDVSRDGRFETVMASDVIRDGMGLELTDLSDPQSGPVLEAFWHDDGSGFDFYCHREAKLPFEVVAEFIETAKGQLPPV